MQGGVPELSTPVGHCDSILLGPSEEPCGMHLRIVHFSDGREQHFPTRSHPLLVKDSQPLQIPIHLLVMWIEGQGFLKEESLTCSHSCSEHCSYLQFTRHWLSEYINYTTGFN